MPSPKTSLAIDWENSFSRLAVVHLLSVGGEALLALSLAGSLFFDVDPSSGREKVLLGLLLTMTPFALVGPLIGPMLNRVKGGHRVTIIATMAARCVVSSAMIFAVANNSLMLFPAAFLMLVLGKTYQIVKASAVPGTVSTDSELVEANSKLQLLSGMAGVAAGIPGVIALQLGPEYVVVLTMIVFGVATVRAYQLPPFNVDPIDTPEEEASELRSKADLRATPVVAAGISMAMLRMMVGFVTFLMAFELRSGDERSFSRKVATLVMEAYQAVNIGFDAPEPPSGPAAWYFGAVLGVSILGGIAGAAIAPRLRQRLPEERILLGSGLVAGSLAVFAMMLGGLLQYLVLAGAVAISAATGKQAFDAIVQKFAPEAERGQLFAKFETRFQIVWVAGALIPTALHLSVTVGAAIVAILALGSAGFLLYANHSGITPRFAARGGETTAQPGAEPEASTGRARRENRGSRGRTRARAARPDRRSRPEPSKDPEL